MEVETFNRDALARYAAERQVDATRLSRLEAEQRRLDGADREWARELAAAPVAAARWLRRIFWLLFVVSVAAPFIVGLILGLGG
jgi:hypothetical protein